MLYLRFVCIIQFKLEQFDLNRRTWTQPSVVVRTQNTFFEPSKEPRSRQPKKFSNGESRGNQPAVQKWLSLKQFFSSGTIFSSEWANERTNDRQIPSQLICRLLQFDKCFKILIKKISKLILKLEFKNVRQEKDYSAQKQVKWFKTQRHEKTSSAEFGVGLRGLYVRRGPDQQQAILLQ